MIPSELWKEVLFVEWLRRREGPLLFVVDCFEPTAVFRVSLGGRVAPPAPQSLLPPLG